MSEDGSELHVILGTGPVGMAVMEELLAQGIQVRMVNRSGKADLPAGVTLVNGDAGDTDFTRRACEGAAVVYQALNPPYDKWAELFPPLQAAAIEGAAAAGAKLISMDNLYMYGSPQGKPLTEEMPYAATTRKGKVRGQMATELLAAHAAGTVRVAIGRASDFFGPRVLLSSAGERLFYPALAGNKVQVLGKIDLPHTYSYMPDIGKGLVTLAQHDEALGQVWHLPVAETVSTRRFLELIGDDMGHELNVSVVPKIALRAIGIFNANLRETLEIMYQYEEPFVMDSSKFSAAFGFTGSTLKEAVHETVNWFRENPKA